jgi:adenosylmethionine-8-amino-7-oxononanoate aminotransferase
MLCTAKIYGAIESGSGFFQHGHTYVGHPTASAAALAVLTKLTDGGLVERCAVMGERLQNALQQAFGQHPNIGDIRGRGLFRGLEIVEDRDTKTPFAPERAINKALKKESFDAGLICYPMGGTIDGQRGDHILLAPPFILEDAHVEEIVSKLQIAIGRVL